MSYVKQGSAEMQRELRWKLYMWESEWRKVSILGFVGENSQQSKHVTLFKGLAGGRRSSSWEAGYVSVSCERCSKKQGSEYIYLHEVSIIVVQLSLSLSTILTFLCK